MFLKNKMIRQGDVLLSPMATLPKYVAEQKLTDGRAVLALGEATGHVHAVKGKEVKLWSAGSQRYVSVGPDGATLQHEEHGHIALAEGVYEVTLQREYEPGGSRMVAD